MLPDKIYDFLRIRCGRRYSHTESIGNCGPSYAGFVAPLISGHLPEGWQPGRWLLLQLGPRLGWSPATHLVIGGMRRSPVDALRNRVCSPGDRHLEDRGHPASDTRAYRRALDAQVHPRPSTPGTISAGASRRPVAHPGSHQAVGLDAPADRHRGRVRVRPVDAVAGAAVRAPDQR